MSKDNEVLEKALYFLNNRLRANGGESIRMLICGGSAMIAMNLVSRVTSAASHIFHIEIWQSENCCNPLR